MLKVGVKVQLQKDIIVSNFEKVSKGTVANISKIKKEDDQILYGLKVCQYIVWVNEKDIIELTEKEENYMKNDLLKLKEKLQSRLEANDKKLEFYNKNREALSRTGHWARGYHKGNISNINFVINEIDKILDENTQENIKINTEKFNTLMYHLTKHATKFDFTEFLEDINITEEEYNTIKKYLKVKYGIETYV